MHEPTNLNAGQSGAPEPDLDECPEAGLRGVHASLRALGVRERAGRDGELESRLVRATVGAVLEPMAARVGEFAARERDGLDSRAELRMARASARATGEPAMTVVRRWWASSALRLAAAVALVATGVLAFRLTRDAGTDRIGSPEIANNDRSATGMGVRPETAPDAIAPQGMDLSEHELLALDGGSAELAPEFGEELDAILVDTTRLDESLHTSPWVDLTDGAMQ